MKDFEYNPAEYAGVTLSEFTGALHTAIEAYNFQFHSGLGDVPMRRWREDIGRFPVRIPTDREQFDNEFALRFPREIGRKGIQFEHLFYNCDELAEMKSCMGAERKVIIAVNPDDIRIIKVIHPTEKRYVSVPCLQEFDVPLPLFLHRSQRLAREKAGREAADKGTQTHASRVIEGVAENGRKRNRANLKLTRTEAEQVARTAKAAQAPPANRKSPPTTLIDDLLAGRQGPAIRDAPESPTTGGAN